MVIKKETLADKLLKELEAPAKEELLADQLLKMLDGKSKSAKEYYDEDESGWHLVETKEVEDSDGFMTDYSWYTDNKTAHIFMFGDRDIYTPDPEYADWTVEINPENPDSSFEQAQEWFDNYKGFAEEDFSDEYDSAEEDLDVTHDPLTPVQEDTVKQGNSWVNKGKEGTHGKFRTKKAADAQRKAMFASGYKANESDDKTINVYNPNVTVHNEGQIGKIKNRESLASEGLKEILRKYNAQVVPGEVDKTYRFDTREDGLKCEKELRNLGLDYHMNSNGDIIFSKSSARESIRGQAQSYLSKSVYENFIGSKKEVRHDNQKRK